MEIGDYVRTPFGITKCSDKHQIIIEDDLFGETKYGYLYYLEDYDDEVCNITDSNLDEYKHSPNIIDLIEVGDYVNGQLVKHIAYFEGVEEPIKKLIFADEYHLIPTEVCEQNEIKSIVTKEQFESMEYRV